MTDAMEGLKQRSKDSRKGDNGRVAVVAGSETYVNTPAIVGLGALRSGCDTVTLVAPGRSATSSSTFYLNFMVSSMDAGHVGEEHVDEVLESLEGKDSFVIGPGLGERKETGSAVRRILEESEIPAVIDADATGAVGRERDVLEDHHVLTPHDREFERLTGETPPRKIDERKELVRKAATELGCTLLLKGPEDVISDGRETKVNRTGNEYMTRGGTGDLLAGIVVSLLSRGNGTLEASTAAAHINGRAGEEALERHGPGFTLEEMAYMISDVMKA